MATLQQLHELIHALDKNEKKFLSLMIDGTAGKAKERYADAFKDINSVKQYDAAKLKARLANGVSGMNLSEANTNFYGFVCKALVAYYGTEKGNIGINKQILLIEILCAKALYSTALKMIDELMPVVESSGTYAMLHRLHELKNNIYINNSQYNKQYSERYRYYDARIKALHDNLQAVQITRLNTRFFELAHTIGDPRTKAQQQSYMELSKDPLLLLPVSAINKRSQATYIQLKLTMEVISGNNDDVFELCETIRDEIRSKSSGQEQLSQEYFIVDFMAGEALQMRHKNRALQCHQELLHLYDKATQKGLRQKIANRILMIQLTVCIWDKDFKKADALLHEWMTEEKKAQWSNANLAFVNFMLAARLSYLQGKPDTALDYLLMLDKYEKLLRPNILISYRFLFLLCHYKLKNYQFLTYATESLYRYLLKLEKLYAPERALLRFVKKCDHFDKVNGEMRKLSVVFEELAKDVMNKPFFMYADYKEWLNTELKS